MAAAGAAAGAGKRRGDVAVKCAALLAVVIVAVMFATPMPGIFGQPLLQAAWGGVMGAAAGRVDKVSLLCAALRDEEGARWRLPPQRPKKRHWECTDGPICTNVRDELP